MTNPNNWPDPDKPGVPLNPERDGWHWLQTGGLTFPVSWDFLAKMWHTSVFLGPEEIKNLWQYIGPCLTPDEVAAREQAASSVACRMNAGELVKVMRLERRVQRQRRALSRLYARRHEWKARERAARREGMEEAARIVETDQWARKPKHIAAAIRAAAKENP